jgi:phosphatidylglycerophosphatase A
VLEAVATVAHIGYVPVVPGLCGSVAGLVVFWLLGVHTLLFAVLTVVLFVVGPLAARHMENKTGEADPSCVVIDEMVAMMAALALVERSWVTAVAAFLAFRFFDIVKPFPGRQLEAAGGGFGIMLDDLVAAAYAVLVVRFASALMLH